MAVRVEILGSGSRGNCTFVQGGRTRLLIDAGLSRREIGRRLETIGETLDDLDAVLVTHGHGDHVAGVKVMTERHQVPVACHETVLDCRSLRDAKLAEWMPVQPGQPFDVGDIAVEPFLLPHDFDLTLGYRLTVEGVVVASCTDLGHVNSLVRDRLSGVNLLILEANHDLDMLRDGEYPWELKQRVGGRHGHLSNEASMDLLDSITHPDLVAVALAHLSEQNNDPEIARAGAEDVFTRREREDIHLVVAAQDSVTPLAVA